MRKFHDSSISYDPVDLLFKSYADGLRSKEPRNSSFQLYFAAQSRLTSLVPAELSLEKAAVLPLAISTASAGLYDPALLGLPLPSADSATIPTPAAGEKVKTALIWGGSSSVGTAAIQLAVASGAHVITTASPQNHDLARSLGASAVFDYHSKTIVSDLVDALKDTNLVGVYDAIALDSSTEAVSAILDALDKKLPVANVLGTQRKTERYQPQFIFASSIVANNLSFIAEGVWGKFVPAALANGSLQAKPDEKVVGHGLESIQGAVDLLRKGVSAQKLIVTL